MGLIKGLNSRGEYGPRVPRYWLIPGVFIVLGAAFQSLGDLGWEVLHYGRDEIADGEYWRLVSGHFFHLNWSHYLLNAAGLVLVWLLIGHALSGLEWLIGTLALAAGIDLGFWFLDPELKWYVGSSGVLHGILIMGLLASWRESPLENTVIMLLVGGKLLYEQLAGPLPGSESAAGGSVVVNAHLYGAVAGALIGSVVLIRVNRAPAI